MKNLARPLIALFLAFLAVFGAAAAGEGLNAADPSAPAEPSPASASPAAGTEELPPEEPEYTLRLAVYSLPGSWGPLHPEEGFAAALRDLLSAGLYEEAMDADGLPAPVPVLAQGAPEDVTALYAARIGVSGGEKRRAYRIRLREGLRWQDGSPLTARDFVDSAMRLLDPEALDPGAALFTEGTLALSGARDYWTQKLPVLTENARRGRYVLSDLTLNGDGVYCTPEGFAVSIALDHPLEELLYGESLRFYVESYGEKCFDLSAWDPLLAQMDADGLVPLTPENYELLCTLTMGNPAWGDTEATIPSYFVYSCPPPPVRWSEVGLMAEDDTALVFLLEKPADPGELCAALEQRWLVKAEIYDACAVREDGRSSYGSSVDTSPSYGPYVLKEWRPGAGCSLERNPAYFECAEDSGLFQTTCLEVTLAPGEEEARRLLEEGLVDVCLLSGRAEPPAGCRARIIPDGAVLSLALNPDPEALALRQEEAGETVNKTILTLPEFRQAISFSLDREALCREAFPVRQPALGLVSPLVSLGAEGPLYRSTAQGKAALAGFWGEAEGSVGYAPETARRLFRRAWTMALEAGLLTEEDRVLLTVGIPGAGSQRSFDLLVSQLSQAVRDTPLEGKLSLVLSDDLGTDPLAALRQNRIDLLLGVGWAVDPADPGELMEAYLEDAYRCDPAWDDDGEILSVSLDGRSCTLPLPDAYALLRGEERTVTGPEGEAVSFRLDPREDPAAEAELLAALEGALLENADIIPLSEGCSTLLARDRLLLPREEYRRSLGFGGLRFLRYSCSDREWAAEN